MLKRKPLKRKPLIATRTPIRKKSKQQGVSSEKSSADLDKMWEMFHKIWKERPHNCQVCNAYLGKEPKNYMFDHLLEKSKYPDLKYFERNILLVCGDCHACKTDGHPKPKHLDAIIIVKEIYGIY